MEIEIPDISDEVYVSYKQIQCGEGNCGFKTEWARGDDLIFVVALYSAWDQHVWEKQHTLCYLWKIAREYREGFILSSPFVDE